MKNAIIVIFLSIFSASLLANHDITPAPVLLDVKQISIGMYHTCVLDTGEVKCWGNNHYGQTDVPALKAPTLIKAGKHFNCALDRGRIKCWGSIDKSNLPRLKNPIEIATGDNHACAIFSKGLNRKNILKCWGDNSRGQLDVPKIVNPIQVVTYGDDSCAINTREVVCWGFSSELKIRVTVDNVIKQIALGSRLACVLYAGKVKCWGKRHNGRTSLHYFSEATEIVLGHSFACVVDSLVSCWEGGRFGQTDVPFIKDPIQILSNNESTCVLAKGYYRDQERVVKCWGGETASRKSVPVLVNPTLIEVGPFHSCALDKEGLKCWGNNKFGQARELVSSFDDSITNIPYKHLVNFSNDLIKLKKKDIKRSSYSDMIILNRDYFLSQVELIYREHLEIPLFKKNLKKFQSTFNNQRKNYYKNKQELSDFADIFDFDIQFNKLKSHSFYEVLKLKDIKSDSIVLFKSALKNSLGYMSEEESAKIREILMCKTTKELQNKLEESDNLLEKMFLNPYTKALGAVAMGLSEYIKSFE